MMEAAPQSPQPELARRDVVVDGTARVFVYRAGSAGDVGVVDQVFEARGYDLGFFPRYQRMFERFRAAIDPARVPLVVDGGANIGASALFYLDACPGARIVAIEPEPHNCELLRRNCSGLPVDVVEAALGDRDGTCRLHDPGLSDWGFRVADQGVLEVRMTTMQSVLAPYPAERYVPLVLKLDIESGERELFARDYDWLPRFPLVVIELHDWATPGQAISRNFLRAVSSFNFDVLQEGENLFCFNNDLLFAPRR